MSNKKTQPSPKTEADHLLDALLGRDEEMDSETANNILQAYSIDPTDLVSEFKSRIESEARKLISENKTVSVPMRNVIKNLRAKSSASDKKGATGMRSKTWPGGASTGRLSGGRGPAGRYAALGRKAGGKESSKGRKPLESLNAEPEDPKDEE